MSSDELGCRMYNDVSSVLDRPDQIRSPECIVNHKWDPMSVCNLCHLLNIRHI